MDKIYLAYLQNKNRAEARRSYKAYLHHLGEIYKSCANSDDPNCVASYTGRPKSKPEPSKPAPIKTCDPTKDTHCLYMALVQGKSPYLPLVVPVAPAAAVKAPAPLYVRAAAQSKEPAHYHFAPSALSFLTKVRCVFNHLDRVTNPPNQLFFICNVNTEWKGSPLLWQHSTGWTTVRLTAGQEMGGAHSNTCFLLRTELSCRALAQSNKQLRLKSLDLSVLFFNSLMKSCYIGVS